MYVRGPDGSITTRWHALTLRPLTASVETTNDGHQPLGLPTRYDVLANMSLPDNIPLVMLVFLMRSSELCGSQLRRLPRCTQSTAATYFASTISIPVKLRILPTEDSA